MSEQLSPEWQELLDTYGMTDDEVDDLFDHPWPGQNGYEDVESDFIDDAEENAW